MKNIEMRVLRVSSALNLQPLPYRHQFEHILDDLREGGKGRGVSFSDFVDLGDVCGMEFVATAALLEFDECFGPLVACFYRR
jgi:hypothetical protein